MSEIRTEIPRAEVSAVKSYDEYRQLLQSHGVNVARSWHVEDLDPETLVIVQKE